MERTKAIVVRSSSHFNRRPHLTLHFSGEHSKRTHRREARQSACWRMRACIRARDAGNAKTVDGSGVGVERYVELKKPFEMLLCV
jgi:hypothetical protein